MQVHKSIDTKHLPIPTHIANVIILSDILFKLLNIKPDFYGKKAIWPYVQRPAMVLKKSLKAKILHGYRGCIKPKILPLSGLHWPII